MKWYELSQRILDNGPVNRSEALAVLDSPDEELLAVSMQRMPFAASTSAKG